MLYIHGDKVKRLHRRRTLREFGKRKCLRSLNELGQAKLIILYLTYIAYPGGFQPKVHTYPKLFNTQLNLHLEPPSLMLKSLSMHCAPQELTSPSENQILLRYLLRLLSDPSLIKPLKFLMKELHFIDSPGRQITSPSRFRDETLHTMDPSELQETTKLSLQKARKIIHELKEKNAELENDMETHRSLLAATETELRDVNMRIQSLSKTLKARDEEAKGLVAKITILENTKADSAKDAERIRNLRLALEQGKQETKALRNDMDIAQTTITMERQSKSRAETSVRALRAEIVILKADIIELRRRATEELDSSSLGHEGQRSYIDAQIEELRELREVQDEQNATIKNQGRELRKFEILKQKLSHVNIESVEEFELDLSKPGLTKQCTEVGEKPRNIYTSPSSSTSGSEFRDLSQNLREQLGAFEEQYNTGSSVSSSPAMTEASGFSSPFKKEFTTRDRRPSYAPLPTTEGEELYTYLGGETLSPEEPQDYDTGDKSPKRIGRHVLTDIQETTSCLRDNGHEKGKDELSLVTVLRSEKEGSNKCVKDEQPDSHGPTSCGRIGLGIFIREDTSSSADSQHCREVEYLTTDVVHLNSSARRNTEFMPDEQTKCKDETSSSPPSTFTLEDEDQVDLSPILDVDAFNCVGDNKNDPSFSMPLEERGKAASRSHAEEEKYICKHDEKKVSILESCQKFDEDNKQKLGMTRLERSSSSSLTTASKTCAATIPASSQTLTHIVRHLQRQKTTTSIQTDDTLVLVPDKIPPTTLLHNTIETSTINISSSSAPPPPCRCPNPKSAPLSSFRACFNSLIRQHPFLSLLYLFFHCLFLILPFLYALTAGFAADRERRMWLSGSDVARRAAVALGPGGGWEGGYWDDFMDQVY